MITIEIGDKEYKVKVAKTPEEKSKGLQGVKELPKDEGMLFDFSEDIGEKSFWMKDTLIPLDIIFINEDEEVTKIYKGEPNSEEQITVPNVKYVLEVNQDSGIQIGDEFDIDDEEENLKMLVLAPNGESQMELDGGERIFSRKSTKILIKKAKKAESLKSDEKKFINACKSLGKYLFKELTAQDNREPEYVESAKD